jgi:hypothetical protein
MSQIANTLRGNWNHMKQRAANALCRPSSFEPVSEVNAMLGAGATEKFWQESLMQLGSGDFCMSHFRIGVYRRCRF